MNAAPEAAANSRLEKIDRSSIGERWWRSMSTNAGRKIAAAIRPPITNGELQPERPPLETPSTSPVNPTRNVPVPRKSNLVSPSRATSPRAAGQGQGDVEPEHPLPAGDHQGPAQHRPDDQPHGGHHRVGTHGQPQ